jgi:O-antigen/teichoic acid export membrane protein
MTDTAHHGSRLARVGLAAALVSRIFSRLVGIVLVVVLAREASTDTVAVYGYLLGTSSLVIALTDLGVASIASREVAAGRLPSAGALRAALVPQAASLVAAAVLTVVLTLVLGPKTVPAAALALTVGCVVLGGFNNLFAELLRGAGRVMLEGALQMGSSVALVAAGVLVVSHGGSATALLVVVLAKEVVLLVLGVVLIRPRRCPGVTGRQLLGQSIWLAVAGTVLIVLWRQGMVVMGAAGSIGALASYVVASRYLDAGVTLAHTAAFGLRPGLSALAGDQAGMRRAVRRYLGLAAVLGMVVALVGLFAAGPLVMIPFGQRWVGAVAAVRVIAVSALPILLTFVALAALVARRQMRLIAVGSIAGTVTGVAVSLALVWWYPDALSAVIGTTVGAAVLAAIFLSGLRDLLSTSNRAEVKFVASETGISHAG